MLPLPVFSFLVPYVIDVCVCVSRCVLLFCIVSSSIEKVDVLLHTVEIARKKMVGHDYERDEIFYSKILAPKVQSLF